MYTGIMNVIKILRSDTTLEIADNSKLGSNSSEKRVNVVILFESYTFIIALTYKQIEIATIILF